MEFEIEKGTVPMPGIAARRSRVLVANIPAAAEDSAGGRYLQDILLPLTRRNAELVASPGTDLVFRFASNGFSHPAFAEFHYLPDLNPHAMIDAVEWAEAEGFDAAVVGCFGDPFLTGIQSAAGIPVVGFGEAAIRAAHAIGPFGIVMPSPVLVEPTIQQVANLGLADSLVGVVASGEPTEEQEAALQDATSAIGHFIAAARQLIARGAQVVVPGCGLLSPALRIGPGADQDYPDGLTEVDGVPVIDVIGCAVRAVEQAIADSPGPTTSRLSYAEVAALDPHGDEMPAVPPGRFWNG